MKTDAASQQQGDEFVSLRSLSGSVLFIALKAPC